MTSRPAIVGHGVVGRAMKTLFSEAVVYDTAPGQPADKDAVNACDVAFVCVPTPGMDSGQCDISAVLECVEWLQTPLIVIRSTVPPGTTESLSARSGKRIVFQPEYLGETPAHPYADVRQRDFIVLGGQRADCQAVADLYAGVYHSAIRFYFTDATTAELAKYMQNAFFATKVLFCTEFRKIAEALGVAYPALREVWLADSRVSPDHTFSFPNDPGFAGKCLPKDLRAIIQRAGQAGCTARLLQSVWDVNTAYRARPGADCGDLDETSHHAL